VSEVEQQNAEVEAPAENYHKVDHQTDETARGEKVSARDDAPQDHGIPAGQLVVGVLSTFVLGGWAVWEWLGLTGLLVAGGAAAAAGGGYGYLRWRSSQRGTARQLASALGLGRSRRRGGNGLGDALGGGVGRRMTFGGKRSGSSSRVPSPFASTGLASGRRVPLSRAPGSRPAAGTSGRSGAARDGRGAFRPLGRTERAQHRSHGVWNSRPARGARAAIGQTARRTRAHGRAINREWTQAARRLSSQAGRGFQRAGRRMRAVDHEWTAGARRLASAAGRRAGRIGRWFDRRTGRVTSLGWRALVDGDRQGWDALRNAYRRWDAQLLFGLLAVTERATRGLRSWWRRRSGSTAPTTEETPNPATPPNPTRLIIPGTRPLYRRSTSMSGLIMPGGGPSPLVAMSAEMVAGVARFLPPDMWWVAADLEQLDQVTGNVAAALRTYARNLSAGYPVDPRIVDMFEEFANTVGKTSDYPIAIATAFRTLHEADIKKRLAPRINEHLWNV